MATVDRIWHSPASAAASRVLDADIEASLQGRKLHPDGTVFVPEDLATPETVEAYRREGSHVAIVSETGSVELRKPRLTQEEKLIIVALVAAALVWLTRSRVPATLA
jgi:hypothetical protein